MWIKSREDSGENSEALLSSAGLSHFCGNPRIIAWHLAAFTWLGHQPSSLCCAFGDESDKSPNGKNVRDDVSWEAAE